MKILCSMISVVNKYKHNALKGPLWPFFHFFAIIFLLNSCQPELSIKPNIVEFSGPIFGANYSVKYRQTNDVKKSPKEIESEVLALLSHYDGELSLWRKDSFLSRFNLLPAGERLEVSPLVQNLWERSLVIHAESQGAFDPSVGALVSLWGFGPRNQDQLTQIPTAGDIREVMQDIGASKLQVFKSEGKTFWVKPKGKYILDFNSVAPGHAADLIGSLLDGFGVKHYLIDVGGELLAQGEKNEKNPWMVGIEKPSQTYAEGVIAKIALRNAAVATSGSYRKFKILQGKKYSHAIDPRSGGQGNDKIISATVIAATALEADAWATACMVLGKEVLDPLSTVGKTVESKGLAIFLLELNDAGELETHSNKLMMDLIGKVGET